MKCSKCGYEMPGNALFCPRCGTKKPDNCCPKCGKQLPKGVRFCGYCGAKIEGGEASGEKTTGKQVSGNTTPNPTAQPMSLPINLSNRELVIMAIDAAVLLLAIFVPWAKLDLYVAYGTFSLPQVVVKLFQCAGSLEEYLGGYGSVDGLISGLSLSAMLAAGALVAIVCFAASDLLGRYKEGKGGPDSPHLIIAVVAGLLAIALMAIDTALAQELGKYTFGVYQGGLISPQIGAWATVACGVIGHLMTRSNSEEA